MSLIKSARPNGHDPYAYLKDVLTPLPSVYRIGGSLSERLIFRREPSRLYQLYGPVAAESLLERKSSKFVVGIQTYTLPRIS